MAINESVAKLIIILLSLIAHSSSDTEYFKPLARSKMKSTVSFHHQSIRELGALNENPTEDTNFDSTERRQKGYDGAIVYPDALKTNCEFGLCYNVQGYPKEKIKRLLNRSQINNDYFKVVETIDEVNFTNRFGDDEMTMCETMVHTVYPEKANNTKQIEKTIVNVDGHKQLIVFETCLNEGKCRFTHLFPSDHTTYCKQKYVHKKLMVLAENSDKFVFDTFEVPSCCVCIVKRG